MGMCHHSQSGLQIFHFFPVVPSAGLSALLTTPLFLHSRVDSRANLAFLQGEGQPFNSDGEGEAEGIVEGVDFDADRTPLEDHIAGQSRLQQMAQDSCRVDEMPEPITHGPGTVFVNEPAKNKYRSKKSMSTGPSGFESGNFANHKD